MLKEKDISYCIPAVLGCLVVPHTALPGACLAPSSLPCIQFGVPGTHAACKAAIQTCPYIFWEFGVLKITVTLIVNAFIVTLIIAIDFLPVGANKYIPEHECTSWDHFVGFLSFTSVSYSYALLVWD